MSADSTDEQLLKRAQQGDSRAFDLLVLRYQHRIMAVVSRFISDRDEVLDVTQDAFIRAWKAMPKFRGDSQFYTWVYRIAVNTAKNHLVAKKRRPPGSDIDINDAENFMDADGLRDIENPENALSGEEMAKAVHEAMMALPEDLRTAVTLREFDGLSYEEIAEVMDSPVGTVRSRIFRAREHITKGIAHLVGSE